MHSSPRATLGLVLGLSLSACDPTAGFQGSWNGSSTLTAGSRTVTKSGVVSVGSTTTGVLVTIQMPLPTMDTPVLSTACALPAKGAAGDVLDFGAQDCPAVALGSGCSLTLKVATAKGVLLNSTSMKINGSGTVIGAGCSAGGTLTESFSFETLVNR